MKSCETTEAVAKLSASWGGPQIKLNGVKSVKKVKEPPSGSDMQEIEVDALSVTFTRKSNGWYHPANDDENEKLAAAGFIRSRGSALVIAPDGRLKAWRVDDKLRVEKLLNGYNIVLLRSSKRAGFILQLMPELARAIVGSIWRS